MKTNITSLYYSPTHTSRDIARAIACGWDNSLHEEYDLTCHGKPLVLQHRICIVAVPVYGGRIAPVANQRLRQITATDCMAIPVVVYGNRDYEDALLELSDLLSEQGFSILSAGAFIGEHSYSRTGMPIAAGRPDAHDIMRAQEFGKASCTKYTSLKAASQNSGTDAFVPEAIAPLSIKGNRPYKTLTPPTPQAPVVTEACTGCGNCLSWCPTHAIFLEGNISDTHIELCTKCCACVKFCPMDARIFDTPYTARLHQNCATRREPECFI